ncbi:MAG TPA: prolipoprotein diacylglyceryl transferase [Candidatus Methylomirabilis sp.]|nr:prolipoprotein diacylglyceryl transferase [Candidatus Methylomirabilis sp.]
MFNFLHYFTPAPILVSFGPLRVYWYGLFVVLGVLAALTVSLKLAKRLGFSPNKLFDLSFWMIIAGIIGARLYHVALEWPYYAAHPANIVKVWQGGLAIHGALLGGFLALGFFIWKEKINFWQLAAIFAPGIALGQAIGRWGNYFNQELFGKPTNLPWGIPIEIINRPAQYLSAEFFHPTFLYESLGDLAIFFILLWLVFRLLKKNSANYKIIFLTYLILYSLLRFSLEFLRLDATAYVFGFRWPQIFSALIFIISIALLFLPNKKGKSADFPG